MPRRQNTATTKRRANRKAKKALLRLWGRFHRKKQVRGFTPAVSKGEVEWRGAVPSKKVQKFWLLVAAELTDRTEVSSERIKLPIRGIQIFHGNAGVVLNERNTVLEQEIANSGKIRIVQQI